MKKLKHNPFDYAAEPHNVAEKVNDQAKNAADGEQDVEPVANNAGTPINTLPRDMVAYLSGFLETNGHLALRSCSQKFFHQVPMPPKFTQILLHHVMRGDLDKVKEMLDVNSTLLEQKVTITDLSGRTFKNITAFQYAVWALDTPMWELILQYLPEEQAAMQLKHFENRRDIIDEHGAHFSFDPILKNLQPYIDHYDGWDWNQREQGWCKGVGGAQRAFPAWLIMTMCEEGEEVEWVKNDPTFTVKRDMKHLTWWMEQEYNGGVLGCKWACVRGAGVVSCGTWVPLPSERPLLHLDSKMFEKISSAQSKAFATLKVQLHPNDDLRTNIQKGRGN